MKLLSSPIARDLAGLAGCALLSVGAGLLHLAAGMIVAGGLLLAIALLAAPRR